MQPAAAPLVMPMRGYIRGVATVRIYPYLQKEKKEKKNP